MTPKVSIIVPCYGVEKYLDRCIESLVNQTLQDIEIIMVDDKSPDRVPEMCDEWATKDSRIKVIHKPVNEGLGMACNTGLDAAIGEYVAFCDSDDWVDAEMYETMYKAAIENDADAVFTGLKRVDDEGYVSPLAHIAKSIVCNGRKNVDDLMLDLIASEPSDPIERHIQMSAKVVLYKHELLSKYNIYFESERKIISEDLFFNLDVLTRANSAVVLCNVFYNYYCNSQSLTAKVRTDRFEKTVEMREALLSRYCDRDMPSEFVTRVNRMFIGYNRTDTKLICQAISLDKKVKNMLLHINCCHPVWKEIRYSYPISKMPLIHKLFFLSTVNRHILFLKIMANANKGVIKAYNKLIIRKIAMGGAKYSVAPTYLYDKLWAFFYKRAMAYCGKGVYLRPMSSDLKGLWNLSIGDYTLIPKGSTFYCTCAPLTIGKKVIFGPNPTIITGDHRIDVIGKHLIDVTDAEKRPEDDAPVVIEDGVWCGANVTILKGVIIGKGSIVAAGAVVTKSCPPYSIIGGVPAKILRMRFSPEEIVIHEKKLKEKND